MDTLRLTLLRHAQAQSADNYPEDLERPLTRRGGIEAREMAQRLLRRALIPDFILVSPAERTWATASILATLCEIDPKQMQCSRRLYLATPETVWDVLTRRDWGCGHVLICGHNPGLTQIAGRFGPAPQPRDLPTAGVATAVWHRAKWTTLQPETAARCDTDEPDNLADLTV
ncbi:MAG: histidine phosphatase family protein [Steroidobacteraceae bacterium]